MKDFIVKGRDLCIMPEILAVDDVIVLPGLFVKCVVYDILFALARQGHRLLVPAVLKGEDLAVAQVVEVGLVWIQEVEVVAGDELNEPLLDSVLTELPSS